MKVFISYRREDSRHIVDRISERLKAALGGDSVFKDVDSIPLGADFRHAIEQAVGQCQVLLAVIGRNWLTVADDKGTLRLHDEQDFVRMEIGTAFSRGIPVIPLLVDEAKVPSANDLPAELAALAFRNGTSIRPDPDFHADMDRLLNEFQRPMSAKKLPFRVLILDENPLNGRFAARVIGGEGHFPLVVASAEDALAAVQKQKFDMALVQVNLAHGDSGELVRDLQRHLANVTEYLPVLGMSSDPTARERCVEAGWDGCLARPVGVSDYRTEIQSLRSLIDGEKALARMGGQIELFEELIACVLEGIPSYFSTIRRSIDEGDAHSLRKYAHTLKGALATFEAHRATDLAREIERLGSSREVEKAGMLFGQLAAEVGRACFALRHWSAPS